MTGAMFETTLLRMLAVYLVFVASVLVWGVRVMWVERKQEKGERVALTGFFVLMVAFLGVAAWMAWVNPQ